MNFHGGYYGKNALLDFSVNIPTLEYPDGFEELMISAIRELKKYPEIDGESAKREIGNHTSYSEEQIILGNGATELIYLYARSVEIGKAMIIEPTFTEYRRALELNEINVISYSLLNEIDERDSMLLIDTSDEGMLKKLVDKINEENVDLLVICNPNNPTGHLYQDDFFERVYSGVNVKNFKMFIDESFLDFVSWKAQNKMSYSNECRKGMFLLRSMTKNYEVPGLRIGYGISDGDTIRKMSKYKEPWSLNSFALVSIPFFLKQTSHLEKIKNWCEEELDFLIEKLLGINGIKVFKPYANFLLIRLENIRGEHFFENMVKNGIYLRRCEDFEGLDNQYYRIAVRERKENKILLEKIEEALHESSI